MRNSLTSVRWADTLSAAAAILAFGVALISCSGAGTSTSPVSPTAGGTLASRAVDGEGICGIDPGAVCTECQQPPVGICLNPGDFIDPNWCPGTQPPACEVCQGDCGISDPPAWTFAGFLPPITNAPTPNPVTAGSAIPVKFTLGGDRGLAILAAGSPSSNAVSCTSGNVGAGGASVAAGKSTLSFDPVTGVYTFVWATDNAWKRTCRRLNVTLTDGSQHEAVFAFDR
jgi:hypothetical protein